MSGSASAGDAKALDDARSPITARAIEAAPESSDSDGEVVIESRAPSKSARREGSRSRGQSPPRRRHGSRGGSSDYDSNRLHPTTSRRSERSAPRPLRLRDREEYCDEDDATSPATPHDDSRRHPDRRQGSRPRSSRPPRAYLNSVDRYEEIMGPDTPKAWVQDDRHFEPSPGLKGPRMYDEEMGGYTYGERRSFQSMRGSDDRNPGSSVLRPDGRIDFRNLTKEERNEVLRLPWTQWMNSSVKNHFVASLGEFIGTAMFLFFAFAGTEVANIGSKVAPTDPNGNTTTGAATGFNVAVLLYISLSFGFSLMVNVWIFFRISGGLFNPAVTLAMLLVRAITPVRAAMLFVSQMLGALLASVVVRWLFPVTLNVRTTLGGGATVIQGVFIEAVLTAELVFTIFMLAKEKHRATFIAPVGIGLALFISEMVAVQYTGGSLNPARSFGPCVVTKTFDPEHWIYWVGPFIGSLIAVAFYKFIKILEYEMANPGADGDASNDPTKNAEKRAEIQKSR